MTINANVSFEVDKENERLIYIIQTIMVNDKLISKDFPAENV